MKKIVLPLAFFMLLINWSFSQTVIYVDSAATGANSGASFADAYNDLQDALAAAVQGDEIWVAKGTYKPDGPDGNSAATFSINKNMALLGGFAGTETSPDQRDPEANPTILSGDLNGDDVDDDFTSFKSDNVMTVVTVGDNVTDAAVINGFTIGNGQADGTISNQELRGGGLYARGPVILQHCSFTQNFAGVSGGGAYLYTGSATDGISMEVSNCRFENNLSDGNGGGLFLDSYGQNSTFTVTGCEFSGNVARWNGGGANVSIRENSNNSSVVVDGCTFSQNTTLEFNGSGFQSTLSGANSNLSLLNSTFSSNTTALFGIATVWGFEAPSANGSVEVSNCLFEQNNSMYTTGLDIGSLPGVGDFTYNITNCDFIGNQASDIGGAMDVYSESASSMTIDGCNFIGNSAGISGGAIVVASNHPGFEARLSKCVFENNSSPTGAAVVAFDFTEEPGMTLDADVTFENCLMTGNNGDAGTINLYNIGTLNLLNCTIADNAAGGIVQSDSSSITLQNTILHNPGYTEYEELTSDVTVTSNGGNLIGDSSLNTLLTQQDKPETAPEFMPGTFEPSSASPLINAGINSGVTEFDLAGNPRIQHGFVDIGAYESDFTTSAQEVIIGKVELSPNPATDYLNVQLPETITQPVEVSIFDSQGRLMRWQIISSGQSIDLKELPKGMYLVKAVAGERVYTGKFVKQ
jgi:type IX secretion system substrate protein